MEIELEPRVKPLTYKVKAVSRESPLQKAAHVLDPDLRTHWSTATNTKEWILLELDEPCLLSHIRIYNKSVLEWEISLGLRYKPETFVKVRPRCEAPRRDMMYPMNYTSCRYVRISCLRGNPIAIFFIQVIGVPIAGLEPEFQPVVNHLLPLIISHKQDAENIYLQLLQDMTNRLLYFLPQLEVDLSNFSDAAESNLGFLAMLAGPLYPILHVVNERETARCSGNISESDGSKNSQSLSALTVSSNFEPRRTRSTSPFLYSTSSSIAFRPDVIFVLLRMAYRDPILGAVCRMASGYLQKLIEPVTVQEASVTSSEVASAVEASKSELSNPVSVVDYSNLFGEEFQMPDVHWSSSIVSVLDIGAVEEGILHVLYACASQPQLCSKLAESFSDFWSALPLVQALLPALRPSVSSPTVHVDDSFSQWKQPFVQQAVSEIVAMSTSTIYRPLLHACAGYLSSYSLSHAKAACVLIDMCSGVLAPWMAQVIAKVDLAVELLEDLLGIIQGPRPLITRARVALKYIVLALSGHVDDVLGKYKEVKHKILFLVEMLEPFLDPAIYATRSTIAFGDVSRPFLEKQEQTCEIALNVIRTAVHKPAVLPSLESEWRRGSVAPSVILSILEPRMQLPSEIDLCKSPVFRTPEHEASTVSSPSSGAGHGGTSSKSNDQDDSDGKTDCLDTTAKMDVYEDVSLFFAPADIRSLSLTGVSSSSREIILESSHADDDIEQKHMQKTARNPDGLVLDAGTAAEYFNFQADYSQLVNFRDCELRASEFRRLALDLHSQNDITREGHDAAIDALLLAAECYVNPFYVMSFGASPKVKNQMSNEGAKVSKSYDMTGTRRIYEKNCDLETIAQVEKKRDKIVFQILLEAAELDRKYLEKGMTDEKHYQYFNEGYDEQVIELSPLDMQFADAVTLVRRHQALLCNFLIQHLQKDKQLMHEVLLQSLVFLLYSATKLYSAPEHIIGVIFGSAEYLNGMLTSLYYQCKEGPVRLNAEKVHGLQRRWILLQRLVIASTGGDEGLDFAVNFNKGFRHGHLIPPSAWIQRISKFSGCASPLVRFLGWMAISRNVKHFNQQQLFMASDLLQLTHLLSIFADELALVDNVVNRKHEDGKIEHLGVKVDSPFSKASERPDKRHEDQSLRVLYPDLSKFFPTMKRQFEAFGETILEAVGLQLRSLSSTAVPDILCWFSELCSSPFFHKDPFPSRSSFHHLKGYVAKNAKAIILYVLESIVLEHMEAMVHEIPRVVHILASLCQASYCDVSFLSSVLCLLNPIISYSLHKVSDEETILADDVCLNFESLCFDELFLNIRLKNANQDSCGENIHSRALTIFVLASVFPDLSFHRRREMLQSLASWTDFASFEPTSSFHDYLYAFMSVVGSCKVLLVQTLRFFGLIPLRLSNFCDGGSGAVSDNSSASHPWFLDEICDSSSPKNGFGKLISNSFSAVILKQKKYHLSADEIEDFSKDLEVLITKLNPTVELCWNLHHQLAKELTVSSAQCFMYSRCLSSVVKIIEAAEGSDSENRCPYISVDQSLSHWRIGLEGLAEIVIELLENRCWEMASVVLDCLLRLPQCLDLNYVIDTICSTIKKIACTAPKIAWRLQTDKWFSLLFARGIQRLNESEVPLIDLFSTMLGHPEPEQRFIALKHLGEVTGQNVQGEAAIHSSTACNNSDSEGSVLNVSESILSRLVSSTWDQVVVMASSDTSLPLRIHAMTLLVNYIPLAQQHQLQSFLSAADTVLHALGDLAHPICKGPSIRLSLALIAGACLHSPAEDISMIPPNVWKNIEILGFSKTEGQLGDLEKKACQVLCQLRSEGEEAKRVLREVLSSDSSKHCDPDFGSTRETILQVLASLTSVDSYFDLFSKKVEQDAMELEEAEIELDIIQKEHVPQQSLNKTGQGHEISLLAAPVEGDNRLQQIKDHIQSLEKLKLQEDIVARRQKKLLLRRSRQKFLEEAALREAELMQELDRERTATAEKEIERQRLLELERAKTRELRCNLDMEKERQTQRELQRELEQTESGLRSSRRDFSASTHRPRDRYRDRENGRSVNEGSARATSSSLQADVPTSGSSMAPTVVLSGSRAFSGQPPTILQSRERADECGSSYDENFEGSRDSGDTGSVGDPELVSAFDPQTGGFGSASRQGSRGSKSRQVVDRREREGRREGKWERKH